MKAKAAGSLREELHRVAAFARFWGVMPSAVCKEKVVDYVGWGEAMGALRRGELMEEWELRVATGGICAGTDAAREYADRLAGGGEVELDDECARLQRELDGRVRTGPH